MKHTLVMMVDDEFGVWNNVGAPLVESVLMQKLQLLPRLSLDEKMAFAEQIFGNDVEEPEIHEGSVTISDGDLAVLQFFDIETTTVEKAVDVLLRPEE